MESINIFIKKHSIILSIGVLIGLSLLTIRPLLVSGFFPMHDDTQPTRIFEMTKALQDGMFPVRWSADLGYGYGYPLFNFYAPFVYYLGAGVSILGADAILATKIVISLGLLFSGIGMYFLARQFWGELGGLLSGLFYLLVPYHALNIYVRGDLAEFWASVFIPFVFWGIWGIYKSKQWRYVVLAAVSYAGVIVSHNLSALMVTPFLISFTAILAYRNRTNKKMLWYFFCSFTIGILLAAFYWLPVLAEMKYTNVMSQIGGKADFSLHFVCPIQLWQSPWGFGGSAPGCVDGMSFILGKMHVILSIAVMLGVSFFIKKQKRQFYVSMFAFIGLLITLFMTTEGSVLIWKVVPGMSFFQYPWRFLLLAAFFSSFLAGGFVWIGELLGNKLPYQRFLSRGLMIVALCAAVFLYTKLFQSQTILSRTVADYTSDQSIRWNISKISDEYLPKGFNKTQTMDGIVKEKIVIVDGQAQIIPEIEKTQVYKAQLIAQKPSILHFRHAYFPAWHFLLDKHDVRYTVTNSGVLFLVSPGVHVFEAVFRQTMLEKFANLLSLAGVAMLFLAIITRQAHPAARIHHGNKKTER
jgi:hypothetical protein